MAMEQEKKKKGLRIVIVLLAVLLGLSLAALAGVFIYSRLAGGTPATVTVPDNLITPEEDPDDTAPDNAPAQGDTDGAATSAAAAQRQATTLRLYDRQPQDNVPFAVGNMFPGDTETRYYCVQVSYRNTVTVHFRADIRPSYEKLAEVLRVRVTLLSAGQELYDGRMQDMPESLVHTLSSGKNATDELYYGITVYLDTSVGNEYQNKDLIADFRWWVEETENLGPSPATGDLADMRVWIVLAVASGAACGVLLVVRRRREEKDHV